MPKIPSVSVISLERELSKIVMLIVTVYYRKRIQIKINKGKRQAPRVESRSDKV